MQEAGIIGLFKMILIIVLVWQLVKFIMRFITPFLLKKVVDTMEKKAKQQYQNNQEPDVKEGEVVIDKKPTNIKESNKNVGEYVDFEEVE